MKKIYSCKHTGHRKQGTALRGRQHQAARSGNCCSSSLSSCRNRASSRESSSPTASTPHNLEQSDFQSVSQHAPLSLLGPCTQKHSRTCTIHALPPNSNPAVPLAHSHLHFPPLHSHALSPLHFLPLHSRALSTLHFLPLCSRALATLMSTLFPHSLAAPAPVTSPSALHVAPLR